MADGIVETAQGRMKGVRDGRVWAWRGVPYAMPPLGRLRFRLPEPPDSWAGVRDAGLFGPAAVQRFALGGAAKRGSRALLSEDCLTLNVWSPAADSRARPVLVWIHGGAFVSGTGAHYGGGPLAGDGDIVVVTINYRLGVFGFVNFADALGDAAIGRNLGLHDTIAALRWVKANIARFGGDPDRVTLAGESAGSIMVSLLMLAEGPLLFEQAIMQSGPINLVHPRDSSARVAEAYLHHLGMRPGTLAALQGLPTQALLAAQRAVAKRLKGVSPAAPWFDGALLPPSYAAARAKPPAPIPLLAGSNRDEITLFKIVPGPGILRTRRDELLAVVDRDLDPSTASAVRGAYPDTMEGNRALGSDLNFGMPTLHFAERQAEASAAVWVYRFDQRHPLLGAYHALELLYLWPFPGMPGAMLRGGWLTGLRSGLSERMRAAWTSFVRTGSPGDDWPCFRPPSRSTRLFSLQDRIVEDPMRVRREAWSGQDVEAGR